MRWTIERERLTAPAITKSSWMSDVHYVLTQIRSPNAESGLPFMTLKLGHEHL
jgi:hypothetical protein